MSQEGPSSDGTPSVAPEQSAGSAPKGPARLRTIVGTASLGGHPTYAASIDRFGQSKELLVLARQVSISTRTSEDSAALVRKSIYQLFLAVLEYHGDRATSFDECREKIRGDKRYRQLFTDLLKELEFIDELLDSFAVVKDDTARFRHRYEKLLKQVPAAQKRVRGYLDGEIRKAGGNPVAGRYGWLVVALAAAALLVWWAASSLSAPGEPVAQDAPLPPPPPPAEPGGEPPPATPKVPVVDPRPPEVKALPGADGEFFAIRPGNRATLKMDQVAPSFFRRFAFTDSPGRYQVRIAAQGTDCEQLDVPAEQRSNKWPAIELYVDGQPAHLWHVDSRSDKEFSSKAFDVGKGQHTLELFFTNDYVDGDRCDRNVVLQWVELVSAEP